VRLFSRRSRESRGSSRAPAAPEDAAPVSPLRPEWFDGTEWRVPDDTYVTDGQVLFRVAHVLSDPKDGHLLVELEDCRTLELTLCSPHALASMELSPVRPITVGG
jgi:hypothetical protein